jgi:hypothetical protein
MLNVGIRGDYQVISGESVDSDITVVKVHLGHRVCASAEWDNVHLVSLYGYSQVYLT